MLRTLCEQGLCSQELSLPQEQPFSLAQNCLPDLPGRQLLRKKRLSVLCLTQQSSGLFETAVTANLKEEGKKLPKSFTEKKTEP